MNAMRNQFPLVDNRFSFTGLLRSKSLFQASSRITFRICLCFVECAVAARPSQPANMTRCSTFALFSPGGIGRSQALRIVEATIVAMTLLFDVKLNWRKNLVGCFKHLLKSPTLPVLQGWCCLTIIPM